MWQLVNKPFVGPLCVLGGCGVLVLQVGIFLTSGWLHSWLIGSGLGLIVVGGLGWFTWLDQRGARGISLRQSDDNFPTADEYDSLLENVDDNEN